MSQEKTNKPSTDGITTPESNPTQAKPAVATDRLELLLELLLSSKQDELEKQAAQKQRQKALSIQREASTSQNALNLIKLQMRCNHLKGKGRKSGRHENIYAERLNDPNVYLHTFIDGTAVIRCLTCGAKWKGGSGAAQNDTSEFLFRNGKKVPNHTKLSWEDALRLVQKSTNQPSSSEVPASQFGKQRVEEFIVPEGFEF
jgi:hypothetical protein